MTPVTNTAPEGSGPAFPLRDSLRSDPTGGPVGNRPNGPQLEPNPSAPSPSKTTPATEASCGRPGEPGLIHTRRLSRWWLAVLVGCVICLPFGWLLSYAAALPFFIGLFFFVLFGLVMGAIMHRTASAGRPYPSSALVVGTTIVVIVGSIAPLLIEAWEHPKDMGARALTKSTVLGNRTGPEFKADVAEDIRRLLRERYAPGGFVGYVRWVLAGGEWKKGDVPGVARTLQVEQRGWVWALRVALSVAMLGFGIASQTFLLRLPSDPAVRRMDERRAQS